jgi:3-oxoacyl-[acyl-carrier protein] reductase
MDLGLEGRVAVVAAASKGLGRAVAEHLAREGAKVAICARSADELERAARLIHESTGRQVHTRVADITDPRAVESFVRETAERYGRLDICVTNCGGPPAKSFLEIGLGEWRSAVDSILMSAVYLARESLPRMRERRWGRLVMITSMSVKQPIEGLVLSSSLRAAVTGLARTLANELGPDGITVNTVCPGYTLTDRLAELAAARAGSGGDREQVLDRWRSEVPVGRIGTADEFAAAVAFLCSAAASYVNGATLAVDGGWVQSLL